MAILSKCRKSRLGLHYIEHQGPLLDLRLVAATLMNAFSRVGALNAVGRLLQGTGADPSLVEVARRTKPLEAFPPPGAGEIVRSRVPHTTPTP